MVVRAEMLKAPGAPSLFFRAVDAPEPRAVLVFLHASLVHSEYYMPLAVQLAHHGVSVWLPDFRGHGRSGGPRGHVRRWTEHRDDAARVVAEATQAYGGSLPVFIGGESYGGLIAFLCAAGAPEAVQGLALLSPAMGLHFHMAPHWRALLDGVVRPLMPRLRPVLPLTVQGISGDGLLGELMTRDRQVVRRYTLSFLLELFRAQDAAAAAASKVGRPILCWLSTGDPICDNRRAEAVLKNAPDITLNRVEAPAHSLVADRPQEVALALTTWILARSDLTQAGVSISSRPVEAGVGLAKRGLWPEVAKT
jgi:alpha-beta hydrolase superfamily lysophospholipase